MGGSQVWGANTSPECAEYKSACRARRPGTIQSWWTSSCQISIASPNRSLMFTQPAPLFLDNGAYFLSMQSVWWRLDNSCLSVKYPILVYHLEDCYGLLPVLNKMLCTHHRTQENCSFFTRIRSTHKYAELEEYTSAFPTKGTHTYCSTLTWYQWISLTV